MPIRRTSNRSSYDSGFYNPEVYSDVGSRVAGYDSDAFAYFTAVEAADGEALENSVKDAYNAFVIGCKSDGIWTAIKASCILAGARTLTGALVPLVGTAPTNNNFVSGDYNRETGLLGNGTSTYLDSNRAGNADPQDSFHMAAYTTSLSATNGALLGNNETDAGTDAMLGASAVVFFVRNRAGGGSGLSFGANLQAGLAAMSRSSSSEYTARNNGTNLSITNTSAAPLSRNNYVFARRASLGGGPLTYASHRLAFYSIGESLNLALLDTRVTALINAIAAAIP
jgi:hypothetical protein